MIECSVFSESYVANRLKSWLKTNYKVSAHLQQHAMHDSYLLRVKNREYFLKIYRLGLKTKTAVIKEWELLKILKDRGVAVAEGVSNESGKKYLNFNSPEGQRYGILTRAIKGKKSHKSLKSNKLLGQLLGSFHNVSEQFNINQTSLRYDFDFLVTDTICAIESFPGASAEFKKKIVQYANRLEKQITTALEQLPLGICHGDAHFENVIFENGTPTFIDFDLNGYAPLAYDLSVLRWMLCHITDENRRQKEWDYYLKGYKSIRAISNEEIEHVPVLAMARHFWVMGHVARSQPVFGRYWLVESEKRFVSHLESIRKWGVD